MNDVFTQLFGMVVSLAVAFGSQVSLVLALVAWAKETFGLKGWAVRVVSLLAGAGLGSLICWVFLTYATEMQTPEKVLVGVLFILGSGLTASGFYDYKNEVKGV